MSLRYPKAEGIVSNQSIIIPSFFIIIIIVCVFCWLGPGAKSFDALLLILLLHLSLRVCLYKIWIAIWDRCC